MRREYIIALIGAAATIIAAIIGISDTGMLELTSLTMTENGELDVKVRNLGSSDALITKISVTLLETNYEPGMITTGLLLPTAYYNIPLNNLKVGQTRSIDASHVVAPNKSDRFLVNLDTTKSMKIELTLTYNKNQKISEHITLGKANSTYYEDFPEKARCSPPVDSNCVSNSGLYMPRYIISEHAL